MLSLYGDYNLYISTWCSNFLTVSYFIVCLTIYKQLMPILEALYNASMRSSNQIYMLLIILLILSQDSSFNASIHKLVRLMSSCLLAWFPTYMRFSYVLLPRAQILPAVPWYKERLLHQTSLGSLMVIILIRTIQFNLSKLRVWLDKLI